MADEFAAQFANRSAHVSLFTQQLTEQERPATAQRAEGHVDIVGLQCLISEIQPAKMPMHVVGARAAGMPMPSNSKAEGSPAFVFKLKN